jgi:hypothetical protein
LARFTPLCPTSCFSKARQKKRQGNGNGNGKRRQEKTRPKAKTKIFTKGATNEDKDRIKYRQEKDKTR